MQSTVTEQGRIAMAVAIAARPLHIAWGLGDEAWDSMDPLEWPSLVKATALVNEVGRRKPSVVGFVTPDDNGSIVVPVEKRVTEEGTVEVVTKRYAYSAEPTAYLYLRADFDYSDAPTATLREVGVFMDTEVSPDCPAGQLYFRPDEIVNAGRLFAAQILDEPIFRSPNRKIGIELVQAI